MLDFRHYDEYFVAFCEQYKTLYYTSKLCLNRDLPLLTIYQGQDNAL